MGLGKRLIDLARSNLNALLDRAASGDTPVSDLSDEELESELSRRQARRLREDAERQERQRAERTARERAEARAKQARVVPPAATGKDREAASARSARAATAPRGGDRRVRELYAQLEVPYGASMEEVKRSFRKLMRKYHPDMHLGDPKKHEAATKLTMTLTEAYRELERHLQR